MRFLFVDRILELIPGESVRGIKHLVCEDIYLPQNKEGRFPFPPSFIGEALGQLTAWNVMFSNDFCARPVAGIVAKAKVHQPVFLGDTIFLESFIDALDAYSVQ